MNNFLIIKARHSTIAVPIKSPEATATLLGALLEAQVVESTGYGKDQRYLPSDNDQLEFSITDAKTVIAEDRVTVLEAKLKAAQADVDLRSTWWLTEQKKSSDLAVQLNDLRNQFNGLQARSQPVVPTHAENEVCADDEINLL